MQTTLKNAITLNGIGLHSGHEISLCLKPAADDTGIVFMRTDVTGKNNAIPAKWDNVVDTKLCTVIANEDDVRVGTIEHLMAALRGLEVDNCIAELNGAEVPIMDGSSKLFIDAIEKAGIQKLGAPRKMIRILKRIAVEKEGKKVMLSPSETSTFAGHIDFDHPEIGLQTFETRLVNGDFKHDISEARTFGFYHEVEHLRKNGLAKGGSLHNAIVLDEEKVMNPSGLRFDDEFIRHKILDAIGDLYLAGAQILGAYEGSKAGHEMNNLLLRALFTDKTAWDMVEMYDFQPQNRDMILHTDDIFASA